MRFYAKNYTLHTLIIFLLSLVGCEKKTGTDFVRSSKIVSTKLKEISSVLDHWSSRPKEGSRFDLEQGEVLQNAESPRARYFAAD